MLKNAINLDALFGEFAESFRAGEWPGHPVENHAPLARLDGLDAVTTSSLLELRPEKVKVVNNRDGEHTEEVVPGEQASHHYHEQGNTICYVKMEAGFPAVKTMLRALETDLGYPRMQAQCNAYASPTGNGFGYHFDAQEVMIVQLEGTKDWRLADNDLLAHPAGNAVAGQPVPMDIAAGIERPFPPGMPETTHRVPMRPGSVLFLPRGHWHATLAGEGPSLSLTLTFPTPTPLSLLLDALQHRLEPRAEWRRPLARLGQRDGRERALNHTFGMLDDWIARDRENAPVRVLDKHYRVRPGAELKLGRYKDRIVLVTPKKPCPLSEPEVPLARWLVQRDKTWFSLLDVCRTFDMPLGTVETVLDAMVQMEVLDRG